MNERYLHISSEEFTNIRLLPSDWDIYYFTDLSLSLSLSLSFSLSGSQKKSLSMKHTKSIYSLLKVLW